MKYTVKYGSTFLADYGEFWSKWVCNEADAKKYASKQEAEVVAYAVSAESVGQTEPGRAS